MLFGGAFFLIRYLKVNMMPLLEVTLILSFWFFFLSASKNNNGKSKDHLNGELDDLRRKSPQLMGMRSVNGRCS